MAGGAPHAWHEPWVAVVLLLLLRLVLVLLHGRPAILECGRLHLLWTHGPASTMIALHLCCEDSPDHDQTLQQQLTVACCWQIMGSKDLS